MNFLEYYFTEVKPKPDSSVVKPDAWRERRVWHITPKTQARNRIKIKYLPAEEQEKYKPQWLKNIEKQRKAEAEAEGKNPDEIQVRVTDDGESKSKNSKVPITKDANLGGEEIDPYSMDFYYYVDDPRMYNVFGEDQIIEATTDGSTIVELEKEGKYVAEMLRVPMEAVKSYKNEDDEWVDFKKITDEQKYDEIKFGDATWFKIDVFPYLDKIRFNLLTDLEDNEEVQESFLNMYYKESE